MGFPRRLYPLVAIFGILSFLFVFTGFHDGQPPRASPEPHGASSEEWQSQLPGRLQKAGPVFRAGVPKPPGHNYSRVLLVARTKEEDVSWIGKELPGLETVIYVADDPQAPLHPPRNKGHEAMIYLSYIIDRYDRLPDVALFMHSHRWTYHNNELHGGDAVQMVKALSNERVVREGYVNLRCHWHEGCPGHLHPLSKEPDFHRIQDIMGKEWPRLFPSDPVPESLSQPCCAQFALSRERIRSVPRSLYVGYRDWLLRTALTDYYSGRIWEYLWQFVFTGNAVHCPKEHVCYCDGFGMCFGGEEQYAEWFGLQKRRKELEMELQDWHKQDDAVKQRLAAGKEGAEQVERPEYGRDVYLHDQIEVLNEELDARKRAALERGKDPKNRAQEAGREWSPGDGF
ncbi:MAG: hypothetical protein M1832_001156 [Thelocarpon impressellum]|nr:MAG: hypothetical protein M1832_001156 [Thelocarpon impressellum]